MSKSNHTEAQIIEVLKQMEAGRSAEEVGRQYGVSKHTIYAWKAKYGGLEVSEAQEFSVVDAFTRECLALETDTSMPSRRITRILQSIINQRGAPEFLLVPTTAPK